ncbi:hypothetical protein TrVE_jg2926 [Triparma verrucosa]|uniref:FAD/NAD(P)-binding domain-containing protein n=1 Tax=Triparma verrucosa TaxID=1606542 RepID=A0A9W7KSE0_9STRA|nr:hypothetical protein TrVE_jg2926 [Triparma verrucosa]
MATVPSEITSQSPSTPTPTKQKVRVVIVGGGFAGLEALRYFRGSAFSYTLIEKKQYHEFTPDIPEAITSPTLLRKISKPFSSCRVVDRCVFVKDIVRFDAVQKRVYYVKPEGGPEEFEEFDYCVLCTGATYTSPIQAPSASTVVQRRESLDRFKKELVSASLPILVIGGGHVGCEVAADIAIKCPDTQVIFATGNSGLLANHAQWQVDYATKFFEMLSNVVLYNERCKEVEEEGGGRRVFLLQKSDAKVEVDVVIQCTGFGKPNTRFLVDSEVRLNAQGKIEVDSETLAVKIGDNEENSECIYAAGDCIDKPSNHQMAMFAHFEGEFCARQILRNSAGLPLRKFGVPPEKCFALSLGPRDGFISLLGYTVMWGRVVPLAKRLVRWGWFRVVPWLPKYPLWIDSKRKVPTRNDADKNKAMV